MRIMGKESGLFHFNLLLLLISFQVQISAGFDSIYPGQTLSGDGTISSKGGVFEMGLFSPGNSQKYYLGIWYKDLPNPEKTVVWVANREHPISDPSSASLEFGEDGNLVLLFPPRISIWSTNLSSVPLPEVGVLGDNGNFILRETSNSSNILWQSFDHPTDTWLPSAPFGIETILTSWKDTNNPALGIFSAKTAVDDFYSGNFSVQVQQRNGSQNKWWITQYGFHDEYIKVNRHSHYWVYSAAPQYNLVRVVLDVSGQLKLFEWWKGFRRWNLMLSYPLQQPQSSCPCGEFSICDLNNLQPCNCIKGFVPCFEDSYKRSCTRSDYLQCSNRTDDQFLVIPNIRYPSETDIRYPSETQFLQVKDSSDCRLACMANCSCTAYAYANTCFIWKGGFGYIQELSSDEEIGGDFYVRVAASEMEESGHKRHTWIVVVSVFVLISLLGISIVMIIMFRKSTGCSSKGMGDSLMYFKYRDLQKATNNFTHKLGEGGFSSVYRGQLPNSTLIAVKVLKGQMYVDKQLRAEVSTIGIIQHKNLVRLRGFCLHYSKKVKLLVYEYMPNGSLESHLFKESTCILDWAKRYNIALRTAKGLAYLHEECRDCIIHCDVKPENILLDADFNPKVADFGLAKLLNRNFNQVLTTMRGTRGYLAPEWFSSDAITAKVDVYSYGQVLFEIISGRRNMDVSNDDLSYYFPALVLNALNNEEEVVSLVDAKLEGEVNVEELTRACKVACWCIQDHEKDRPTMAQVIQILEGFLDVGIPPIPQFFQSLAKSSMKTSDIKGSKVYSTSSSLPYSFSFQPSVQSIHHMS